MKPQSREPSASTRATTLPPIPIQARTLLSSPGFAAVDALVALTILGLTLALVLTTTNQSRHIAAQALEARRADLALQAALATAPRTVGVSRGRTAGLAWQVAVQPVGQASGGPLLGLCSRTASATGADARRRYVMTSVETCPLAASGATR